MAGEMVAYQMQGKPKHTKYREPEVRLVIRASKSLRTQQQCVDCDGHQHPTDLHCPAILSSPQCNTHVVKIFGHGLISLQLHTTLASY
jgi:hypothetical protein